MRTIRSILMLFLISAALVRGGYAVHGQFTHNKDEFNWGMAHALLCMILLFILSDRVKVKKD